MNIFEKNNYEKNINDGLRKILEKYNNNQKINLVPIINDNKEFKLINRSLKYDINNPKLECISKFSDCYKILQFELEIHLLYENKKLDITFISFKPTSNFEYLYIFKDENFINDVTDFFNNVRIK